MALFAEAVREESKLIMAVVGPTGGGKTFTAIRVARALIKPEEKLAVADSEYGRAKKYALRAAERADPTINVSEDGNRFRFSHLALTDHSPQGYIAAIEAAKAEGFACIVIDSMTHEWERVLEMVDEKADAAVANRPNARADPFGVGWRAMTPEHRLFIQRILDIDIHVICTIRSDMEFERKEVGEGGQKKTKIEMVGLKPKQRGDTLYAFDIALQVEDAGQRAVLIKNTCPGLRDVDIPSRPGESLANILREWIMDGIARQPPNPLDDLSLVDRRAVDKWMAENAAVAAKVVEAPEEERQKTAHGLLTAAWKAMKADPETAKCSEQAKAILLADHKAKWLSFGLKPWWQQSQAAAG